jgi:hypothetical protein
MCDGYAMTYFVGMENLWESEIVLVCAMIDTLREIMVFIVLTNIGTVVIVLQLCVKESVAREAVRLWLLMGETDGSRRNRVQWIQW